MNSNFKLREIQKMDWKITLDWANEKNTRQNSFKPELISEIKHKEFINNSIINSNRNLFILEYNEIPVGALREDKIDKDTIKLSYTISPLYRGKRIGQIMLSIYLIDKKGKFLCEIKKENISSFRMIEKLGFDSIKNENGVYTYELVI